MPKLALPVCAVRRAALPEPQLVEQLVELPTVLSYSLLQQRTVEQITSTLQLLMVVEEVLVEVFKVFPKDRVPLRLPVSRPSLLIVEVFKVFLEERVPQRLPLSRLFPRRLTVRYLERPQPSESSVSSWTRAAHEDQDSADEPATQQDDDEELLLEEEDDPSGWRLSIAASGRPFYWHRSSRRSLWHLPPGASLAEEGRGGEGGPGCPVFFFVFRGAPVPVHRQSDGHSC